MKLITIVLMLLACSISAAKETSGKQLSIEHNMVQGRYIVYKEGIIMSATAIKQKEYTYTIIRMLPYATNSLIDNGYIFCGDRLDMFDAKTGLIVIAYDATGAHEGGCYDLLNVNSVAPPKLYFDVRPPRTIPMPSLP